MGEASNDSSLDRIRSTATSQALARTPSSPRASPLPLNSSPSLDASLRQSSSRTLKPHTDSGSSKSQHQSHSEKNGTLPTSSVGSSPPTTIQDTKEQGETDTAIDLGKKPSMGNRVKAGAARFVQHTKDAIFHSWVNVLLVFVPIGIASNWIPMPQTTHATVVFALNAVAIVPLAGLLSHATESVASRMGDTWASLLNVTFGNAVELIIFIIALAKREIEIVQASILGSILANLLLILGMAFLLGGLRYQEQIYNSTVTQMSACLLSLSVTSLLLPTAFHASFKDDATATKVTLKVSRGTSVVLLLVYILYLLFQLKSHAYMYESTPQQIIDEESHPGVFAEMMNSSSSDDSSSSDSTDSDSSSGSYSTAKRRFRKVFKRRKSNASSFRTASVVSALSSPSVEKRNVFDEPGTPPHEHHFELGERPKMDRHAGGIASPQPGAVLSGDEADGENDRGAPRIRDFETEQGGISKSHGSRRAENKQKKHRMKKEKKKSKKAKEIAETNEVDNVIGADKSVDFAPLPSTETTLATTQSTQSSRPFAVRLSSRVRPPLPHVFTNTVFSAPQRTPAGPVMGVLPPMNRAASAASAPRRANSLPNNLHRQGQGLSTNTEPAQRAGVLVVNEADAIHKDVVEDGVQEEPAHMSRTAAVMLLLISTGLVAFCAELLVEAIPDMVAGTNVSPAFIGLIILPIVGNAAEHVTAVTVAAKNKMDLAIGVAVGSSIQIALFVTPFIVLLGWAMGREMSLHFNLFDTVSLFVTAFVVNFLVLDGRSNYLEGSLLIAAYVIIAVAAFFYPNSGDQSVVGGGVSDTSARF